MFSAGAVSAALADVAGSHDALARIRQADKSIGRISSPFGCCQGRFGSLEATLKKILRLIRRIFCTGTSNGPLKWRNREKSGMNVHKITAIASIFVLASGSLNKGQLIAIAEAFDCSSDVGASNEADLGFLALDSGNGYEMVNRVGQNA